MKHGQAAGEAGGEADGEVGVEAHAAGSEEAKEAEDQEAKEDDARPANNLHVKVPKREHEYIQLHKQYLMEKRDNARLDAKKKKWKRQALRKGRSCANLAAALFKMNAKRSEQKGADFHDQERKKQTACNLQTDRFRFAAEDYSSNLVRLLHAAEENARKSDKEANEQTQAEAEQKDAMLQLRCTQSVQTGLVHCATSQPALAFLAISGVYNTERERLQTEREYSERVDQIQEPSWLARSRPPGDDYCGSPTPQCFDNSPGHKHYVMVPREQDSYSSDALMEREGQGGVGRRGVWWGGKVIGKLWRPV